MSRDRIVISGVNGFVGHHLAIALHKAGMLVVGIGQDSGVDTIIEEFVDEYYQADLTTTWPVTGHVKAIIHLAGIAAVGPSFDSPQKYINVNSSMVTNLCEYYLNQEIEPRIILVSSGAIYEPNQSMPINEDSTIGFNSPYALSKVLNENQATYYRNRGLDCIVVRPFNHVGPGQAEGFILPDFYKRLSRLDKDQTVIGVGNIDTRRDYTDVRDIVQAYMKLALAPVLKDTVYNICSGKSLSGSQILDKLKVILNREDVTFQTDPSLVRPTDIQEITGDSSRLSNELDWQPKYEIDQTIKDFVDSKSN